MMGGYYGAVKIGDGIKSYYTTASLIKCTNKDGSKILIKTLPYETLHNNNAAVIWEHKEIWQGKYTKWLRYGAFYKEQNDAGRVFLPYHPKSRVKLHGYAYRTDQLFMQYPVKVRTKYSGGRFLNQVVKYLNGKIAYQFKHNDLAVQMRYPDGQSAGSVECPGGFSTAVGTQSWKYPDTKTCPEGTIYFNADFRKDGEAVNTKLDYSKDGCCKFRYLNLKGKVILGGELKSRQKVGQWILNAEEVYFFDGIPISKKLWDMDPAKLKAKACLRVANAQLRAALLHRIGPERLVKELKATVIHQDGDNKLYELPVEVDSGNRDMKSRMRYLQVRCPSTGNDYHLQVPDFVWDNGNKTRLDTCELARQWTFGIDNPKQKIIFAKET